MMNVAWRPKSVIRCIGPPVVGCAGSRLSSWLLMQPVLSPDGKWLAMLLTDGPTTNIWDSPLYDCEPRSLQRTAPWFRGEQVLVLKDDTMLTVGRAFRVQLQNICRTPWDEDLPLSCAICLSKPVTYPTRFARESGSSRTRFPVAAKMALHRAGAKGGTPGSPTPAGGALLLTMWTLVW